MKGRKHSKKFADGGEVKKANKYNAIGSPAMASAEDETADGFKKGGKAKHKRQMKADGGKAKERLDKMARGGRAKFAKGGSVYSSSRGGTKSEKGGAGAGHPGEMPPEILD